MSDVRLSEEQFGYLVHEAMRLGGVAARGVAADSGNVEDVTSGLVRSAAMLAVGRHTSRRFPPALLELRDRIVDEVVRRAEAMQAGRAVA
jgi:hypothetical protein